MLYVVDLSASVLNTVWGAKLSRNNYPSNIYATTTIMCEPFDSARQVINLYKHVFPKGQSIPGYYKKSLILKCTTQIFSLNVRLCITVTILLMQPFISWEKVTLDDQPHIMLPSWHIWLNLRRFCADIDRTIGRFNHLCRLGYSIMSNPNQIRHNSNVIRTVIAHLIIDQTMTSNILSETAQSKHPHHAIYIVVRPM